MKVVCNCYLVKIVDAINAVQKHWSRSIMIFEPVEKPSLRTTLIVLLRLT